MNELIQVTYDREQRPTVMGRDLHEALGIRTAYKDWFPRMCEYGFTEGTDFCSILSESTGGRPGTDHQLTIEMAKEICMIQRTEMQAQRIARDKMIPRETRIAFRSSSGVVVGAMPNCSTR